MLTYTTDTMTGKQADDFAALFDKEIGTEHEIDGDAGEYSVTCFELTSAEVAKCRRIENRIAAEFDQLLKGY